MAAKFNPCPFCASKTQVFSWPRRVTVISEDESGPVTAWWWQPQCLNENCLATITPKETELDAAKWWNTRKK